MKRWIGLMVACLALATVAGEPEAKAEVNTDGYAYSGGYYWYGNVAYIRELAYYWVDGYYKRSACNCYNVYTPGYWQGYYKYAVAQLKGEDAVVNALTDRMRTQNLMAKEQQRHANLLELVKATGLEGNFRFEGYFGGRQQYPPAAPYYPAAATTHGFSYQQIREDYGQRLLRDIPYDLAAQQAARTSDNSRSANDQLYGLLSAAGIDDARVREILARSSAAAQVLRATEPQPSSKVETKVNGTTTTPQPQVNLPQAQNIQAFLQLSGPAKCVGCHSGETIKGKFDVTKLPTMKATEIVKVVLPYIVSEQGEVPKCPPASSGIKPTTAAEVRQFLGGN